MHIEKPVLGDITQGSIFTAANTENYSEKPTWGLCITARCDMAHENKVQVFNYIPIVRYEDWILEDGAKILINRIKCEVEATAKDFLRSKGKADDILDFYPPNKILNTFFPENLKFKEITEKLESLKLLQNNFPSKIDDIKKITIGKNKTCEKFLKELWSNQLSGYYYLDDIGETEFGSKSGYVILLREVHHVPKKTAKAIGNGILLDNENGFDFRGNLNSKIFDFSYTIGVLKSPWIEHLMQQFSIMFSRIGLPDPSTTSLTNLNKATIHE